MEKKLITGIDAPIEEEVKIIYPKVKLRFNDLLTTAIRFRTVTKGGILLGGQTDGNKVEAPLMSTQIVVAAGDQSSYKVGDVVEMNLQSFERKPIDNPSGVGDAGYRYIPPFDFIAKNLYLFVTDRQLKYSYEGYDLEGEELLIQMRDEGSFK